MLIFWCFYFCDIDFSFPPAMCTEPFPPKCLPMAGAITSHGVLLISGWAVIWRSRRGSPCAQCPRLHGWGITGRAYTFQNGLLLTFLESTSASLGLNTALVHHKLSNRSTWVRQTFVHHALSPRLHTLPLWGASTPKSVSMNCAGVPTSPAR